LYTQGHIYDAAQRLVEIASEMTMTENLKQNKLLVDWLNGLFLQHVIGEHAQSLSSEFTDKCLSKLRKMGDEASSTWKHDEALSAYSTILLLSPSPPEGVLTGWARIALVRYSTNGTLGAAGNMYFMWLFRTLVFYFYSFF
jgi:hypothetical protein